MERNEIVPTSIVGDVPSGRDPDRLRLLCLALQTPLPADSGDSIRVLGLLRALAARHDIEFVCVRRWDTDDADMGRLDSWLAGGLRAFSPQVAARTGKLAVSKRWARALAKGDPPWLWSHWNPDVSEYLKSRQEDVDAVVFLDNAVTIYWPSIKLRAPFIVDIHNVAGWSVGQSRASGWRTPRLLLRSVLGRWLMRRSERRSVGAMRGVIVTSDEERRRLFALYGTTADAVIPSGIDPPRQGLRARGTGTVGWLGGHGYAPNRDGLARFVSQAWKPLGQAGYRLLVAGANPPAEIVNLAKVDGVEILGFVEDLAAFLSQVDVAVVPLWAGAGVKLKTVTFMGSAIPVVSTPVGVEGTGVMDGVHALVREEPSDIAAGLRELLSDSTLAERIASNGRSLVLERLTWPRLGAEFVATVEQIAGAGSLGPPPTGGF